MEHKTLVIQRPNPDWCSDDLRARLRRWCDAPRHTAPIMAEYLTLIMPNELGENEFVNHCEACAREICRDIGEPWPPPEPGAIMGDA